MGEIHVVLLKRSNNEYKPMKIQKTWSKSINKDNHSKDKVKYFDKLITKRKLDGGEKVHLNRFLIVQSILLEISFCFTYFNLAISDTEFNLWQI